MLQTILSRPPEGLRVPAFVLALQDPSDRYPTVRQCWWEMVNLRFPGKSPRWIADWYEERLGWTITLCENGTLTINTGTGKPTYLGVTEDHCSCQAAHGPGCKHRTAAYLIGWHEWQQSERFGETARHGRPGGDKLKAWTVELSTKIAMIA